MCETSRAFDGSSQKKSTQKKRDFILIAVLLAAAVVLFAGRKLFSDSQAVTVSVSVDGQETMTLDLNRDEDIVIESPGGQTNRLIIRDGTAFMTEASCPDKLCVRQGAISETGQSIVCLPNKVIVTITGTK